MTDQTVAQPGTVALEPPSTVLNPETVSTTSGGGKVDIGNAAEGSIESVLEGELSRLKAEDAKLETDAKEKAGAAAKDAKEKADAAAKTEKGEEKSDKQPRQRSDDGKFTKAETEEPGAKADKGEPEKAAAERSAPEEGRQSEGRKYAEPPARFLPEARGKWANVPNEVKAEFHRVAQEYEQENAGFRQSHERYQELRQYDEIARGNGRDLRQSLEKIVNVERAIAQNPIVGLDMVLREIGPRKQDGTPLTLMEVARHIVQNPQAYQSAAAPMPLAPQNSPEVKALESKLASLETRLATASIQPVIDAFANSHPDYAQLEPQIAAILEAGVIEKLYGDSLSADQKLAEAYRMAGGRGPSSRSEPEAIPAHSEPKDEPSKDAGTKSIRGAPANGEDTVVEDVETDIDAILRKEMRKIRA
ncbi:hypothetical protein NN6n1_13190 [Shinella zoogloeoides]